MDKQRSLSRNLNPLVIGGVGGSGTRLIAHCLKEVGFYIGTDLNEANDNLWFTLLFKRIEVLSSSAEEFEALVEIFVKAMTQAGQRSFTEQQIELVQTLASEDRSQHPTHWLRTRANTLLFGNQEIQQTEKWGWKEPNSHIVLDRLIGNFPNMKYIHVARNGLDMAHSTNQNQLKLWGKYFLNEPFDISPQYSLKFWCIVHERVIRIGESMGDNFLFLNYDSLCADPQKGIEQLLDFLDEKSASLIPRLVALIKKPSSTDRFRQYGTKNFAEKDMAFVKSLGFDINGS